MATVMMRMINKNNREFGLAPHFRHETSTIPNLHIE